MCPFHQAVYTYQLLAMRSWKAFQSGEMGGTGRESKGQTRLSPGQSSVPAARDSMHLSDMARTDNMHLSGLSDALLLEACSMARCGLTPCFKLPKARQTLPACWRQTGSVSVLIQAFRFDRHAYRDLSGGCWLIAKPNNNTLLFLAALNSMGRTSRCRHTRP